MNRPALASLILMAMVFALAFSPREYARVSSPDGRHVAVAKYRACQAWLPRAPGDAGSKAGWISILTSDGEKVGTAGVDHVAQIQDLRWTANSVELPLSFAMALTRPFDMPAAKP